MTSINGITNNYYPICGPLDGSNVKDLPAKNIVLINTAPPINATPANMTPISVTPKNTTDEVIASLNRTGKWTSNDGKIIVMLEDLALNDPGLDHADMDGHLRITEEDNAGKTIYCVPGGNGKMRSANLALADATTALIVVPRQSLKKPALLAITISHELQHASDEFSGERKGVFSRAIDIAEAPRNAGTKHDAISIFTLILFELRAQFAQLDYFLKTNNSPPETTRLELKATADIMSQELGYKNMMFSSGAFNEGDLTIMKELFNECIPPGKIDRYNSALSGFGVVINENKQNSLQENQEVVDEITK